MAQYMIKSAKLVLHALLVLLFKLMEHVNLVPPTVSIILNMEFVYNVPKVLFMTL